MNPPIARASIFVVLCLAGLLQADTKLGIEPTSGVVVREGEKVWFDGDSTRTESDHDGKLAALRYWVIDHPQFGAFTARRVMGGDTPETNEVVRIWVGD